MFEIGLDISSSKISAVECFKTNKGIFIKNAGTIDIEPHAIAGGELVDSIVLVDGLKKLWKNFKFQKKEVNLGLASTKLVIKEIELPVTEDKEIEKYSGIKISTINFKDLPSAAGVITQNPIGNIVVDLNVTGTFYQMLTFLNTLEIMPRFAKIESISINANQASSDNAGGNTLNQIVLSATISFSTYYDKTDYKNN